MNPHPITAGTNTTEPGHNVVARALDLVGGGEIMSRAECFSMLQSGRVGRLGVVAEGRVEIFPVNYVLERGRIVFRTNVGRKWASTENGPATFEIDDIDLHHQSGWSVVVHGKLEDVTDAADQADHVEPWAGAKERLMALDPEQVTGRRVRAHQLD